MELIIRSRSFLLSVWNCFIQILPSLGEWHAPHGTDAATPYLYCRQTQISTPARGVLIRILVWELHLSRKAKAARPFVTRLLPFGRFAANGRAMAVRSASITVPRNAPFHRTTTPQMVEPKGERTSSFNWPGCLPDSSTSFAEPKTACAAICCVCGRFSPSATPTSQPSPITSENSSSPKRFRRYSFSSPSAVSGSSSKRTSILSMRKPSITRAIIVIFVPS